MKNGAIKHLLLAVLFSAIAVIFPVAQSFSETITRIKEYRYQASEIDSKLTCQTQALTQVKRLLLEEIGTYLVSNTEVKNFQLTKDQIATVAAGIVRTRILGENWDGRTYYLKAEMEIDSEQANKLLDSLQVNSEGTRQLDEIIRKLEQQDKEIQTLKRELTKKRGANDAEKEKYMEAVQGLSATEWMIKGYTAINEERFNDAIQAYNKALEITPQNDTCYHLRGVAFARSHNPSKAIEDLNRAIDINPAFALAYKDRAIIRFQLGETELAFRDINRSLEINSKEELFYSARGVFYAMTGNQQEAIEDHTYALQLNPLSLAAYIGRANAYASAGKNEDALKDFSKAVELHPEATFAFFQRGNFYNTLKDYPAAITDLTEAITLARGLPSSLSDAYTARAWAYQQTGRLQEAMQDATEAITLFPTSFAYYQRGIIFSQSHKYQEALSDFNKAIELGPRSPQVLSSRGIAHLAFKDFPSAISDFTEALQIDPGFAPAYAGRAFTYEKIGNNTKSIEDRKIAAKLGDPVSQKLLKEKGIDWTSTTVASPPQQLPKEKTTGQTAKKEPEPVRAAQPQETQYSNFSIKLTSCRYTNNNILCDLLITNKDPDRVLGISNDVYVLKEWLFKTHRTILTRIFDDIGNEYKPVSIQFGGKKDKMPQTSLVKDIPARAVLIFDSVSPEPTRLPVLEIGFFDGDSNAFKITFRDILLYKGSGASIKAEVEAPLSIRGKYILEHYKLEQSDGIVITESDMKVSGTTEIDSDTFRQSVIFGNKETKISGRYELFYKTRNSGTYVLYAQGEKIEGEFEIRDNKTLLTHVINTQKDGIRREAWNTWTRIGQ
jgi:tetratricopeptide (TPR) repeat protein